MKIQLAICAFFTVQPALSNAHTEAETNEMVRLMVETVSEHDNSDDLISDDGESSEEVDSYASMDGVFSGDFGTGWTPADRKNAFDAYLMRIANSNNSSLTDIERELAENALRFSSDRFYTNTINAALAICANSNAPCREVAWEVVSDRAESSPSMNSLVANACTNALLRPSRGSWSYFCYSYSQKLNSAADRGMMDTARDGAKILYPAVNADWVEIPIDTLLVRCFPQYAVSSNRLALANLYLSVNHGGIFPVDIYFADVTNQLHQAAQPLPVVPELSPTP